MGIGIKFRFPETEIGAREYSRAPVLFNIPMLPPSVSQADAALSTTTSQNLAAVGSGHALTETMLLGALTLLGLIGTNHAGTPPVQFGGTSMYASTTPDWARSKNLGAYRRAFGIIA